MAAAVWHLFVFLCFFFANVRAKNNAKFNLLKIFNQSVSSAYFFGGTLNMQILIKMRHANIAKMWRIHKYMRIPRAAAVQLFFKLWSQFQKNDISSLWHWHSSSQTFGIDREESATAKKIKWTRDCSIDGIDVIDVIHPCDHQFLDVVFNHSTAKKLHAMPFF